jgi:hypothetical protein
VVNTLSIFDANDLVTTDKAQKFAISRDVKDLESFIVGLRRAMLDDGESAKPKRPNIDHAVYLPSASLRGDSGCLHWNCRLPKIRALSRYVALYCDKAIVPVTIRRFGEKLSHEDELFERFRLLAKILGIMELRPLLEAGLVTLIPGELHLCREHWDEGIPEHKQIMRVAQGLASSNAGKFSVTYNPPTRRNGHSYLNFTGPEEYLEHGQLGTVLGRVPRWVKGARRNEPVKLSTEAVRKHKLLLHFFGQMANDAFLQTYFGAAFDARYVTDSLGESEFFDRLYHRDALAMQTAALCSRLTHTIPLMADTPIEVILKLRNAEPEAFTNYRSALTDIVKNYASKANPVRSNEAKEIYLDLLKPRLDALEVQARNLRKSQIKKSLLKVAAASALVGLGIYGGVLPAEIVGLVKTIGGFSVAKDLAETLGAIEKNPTEVRNHNLYFLLRLKQAAKNT